MAIQQGQPQGVLAPQGPLAQNPMQGQEYPKTAQEKDTIVEQTLGMVHSPEITESISKTVQSMDPARAVETMSTLATTFGIKIISTIEDQTKRDISPRAEIGIIRIVVEELMTIATQFGLQVDKAMVGNTIQKASNSYKQQVGGM